MIDMENVSDKELEKIEDQFHDLTKRLRNKDGLKNHSPK